MKRKIALFQSKYGYVTREPQEEAYTSAVRISEYIEIDFPMLNEVETIGSKITALEKAIDEIKNTAKQQVSELQVKKQELLALTANASANG